MADPEAQQPVDSAQQVTSKAPITKPKNPKRVAAGKAIAQKTKQAREAQKKNWPRLKSSSQTTSSKKLKLLLRLTRLRLTHLRLTHLQLTLLRPTHHQPKTFLQPHNG